MWHSVFSHTAVSPLPSSRPLPPFMSLSRTRYPRPPRPIYPVLRTTPLCVRVRVQRGRPLNSRWSRRRFRRCHADDPPHHNAPTHSVGPLYFQQGPYVSFSSAAPLRHHVVTETIRGGRKASLQRGKSVTVTGEKRHCNDAPRQSATCCLPRSAQLRWKMVTASTGMRPVDTMSVFFCFPRTPSFTFLRHGHVLPHNFGQHVASAKLTGHWTRGNKILLFSTPTSIDRGARWV